MGGEPRRKTATKRIGSLEFFGMRLKELKPVLKYSSPHNSKVVGSNPAPQPRKSRASEILSGALDVFMQRACNESVCLEEWKPKVMSRADSRLFCSCSAMAKAPRAGTATAGHRQ